MNRSSYPNGSSRQTDNAPVDTSTGCTTSWQRPTVRHVSLNPLHRILSFFSNRLPKKTNAISTEAAESYLLAEKERVEAVRVLMNSKDYTAALSNLMADSNNDLHYFNRIKGEVQGEQHLESFSRKHGKLVDFEERPSPVKQLNICTWSGEDEMGHPLRCQNTCLYPPDGNPGVEQPKSVNCCVYHVKYCVNTEKHAIPMKIRKANNCGLCNECFILRNSCPPKDLDEIPGIVRR